LLLAAGGRRMEASQEPVLLRITASNDDLEKRETSN
jgi:hypothetical protein